MKTILIVDDYPPILTLMSELIRISIRELSNVPVEIYTASSGEDAIALSCNRGINLLITDYHLSGITGLELIRTITSKRDDILTILMSSDHDLVATLLTRPEHVADALLKKPVDGRDLKRILRSFLGEQIGAKYC